jgi:hypothetical protein
VLTVEWPGAADRFALWKGLGDIFGTDLYPIPRERRYGKLPNHDITQMRDYIAALRAAHGDRPILLVLQGWAWDPLKDGERGYPTPHESRFMAYQAVIHGARGLFYYGQLHCSRPSSAAALTGLSKDPQRQKEEFKRCVELNKKFWDGHRSFFKELSYASRVFVLPEAAPELRIQAVGQKRGVDGNIESITKQAANGDLYLLAVNAGAKQRPVFQLPAGVNISEIHVLFEGRKLPVIDGTFADTFGPYDTYLYATTGEPPR